MEEMMMRKKLLWTVALVLPLAVAGVVFAASQADSFVCPVTDEELPCPACCPLNQGN
jgi:hypothetical protein